MSSEEEPLTEWHAASEWGTLEEVLLCPPDHFHWRDTSAISRATLDGGRSFDHDEAIAQHRELVSALEGAGVRCHALPTDPALHYQVFARDSSVMTPWGPLVTQLHQSWRRGEYGPVIDFFAAHGVRPWRKVTAGALEGGDVILVAPGVAVIGSGELRTEWAAAEQLAGWLREEGWEVRIEPIPQRYVHLDVIMCMLAPGLAAVCSEIASGGLVRWLTDQRVAMVDVPERDAFGLGVNVLSLGDDRVVSAAAAETLNVALRAHGLTVLDPDLSAFTRGGGGPHCLTQALRRA